MCGIVAGIAERNIVPILLEGLKRLEYRGYDSAGLAVNHDGKIDLCRAVGKVASLVAKADAAGVHGNSGIAHTSWATHGVPSEANAHPQMSGSNIAVVHNGIIENYQEIRDELQAAGYSFTSDTDTETIAHLIDRHYREHHDLLRAVRETTACLRGAYAIARAAKALEQRHGCLYLGRGENYAIAAEGALKLKELTYIHAEAHPAGELKHGPLALVDENMPVLALIKHDALAEKISNNLEVVQARGGRLILFVDDRVDTTSFPGADVIRLGELDDLTASIAFVVPLQLFAYHVALLKGTDVDQPRNLAKSVTVE